MAKRSVRRTIYGNLQTYEGGKWLGEINGCGIDSFSDAEDKAAAAFLAGRDDWRDAAWED
jgi:hypothetical protein